MKIFSCGDELVLPVPLEEVFSCFAEARNLERIFAYRHEVLRRDSGAPSTV